LGAPKLDLTIDSHMKKARAERFGIPVNASPTANSQPSNPSPSAPAQTKEAKAPAQSSSAPKKEKAGGIDKTSLGIDAETLAKRAAKFGLPEKKAATAAPASAEPKSAAATSKKAEVEMTP
jgi:hypothetical protein